jgi:hypothetical protein
MNPLRDFEEYIKQGIIKKQSKDVSRAEDLIKESERKFSSLKIYAVEILPELYSFDSIDLNLYPAEEYSLYAIKDGLVDLTGLPAGDYTFEVDVKDNVGNENIKSVNVTLEEGIYVNYIDPAKCEVSNLIGGSCDFTFNVCVRGRDSIRMWLEKMNGNQVSPFAVNATISKNGEEAKVGLVQGSLYTGAGLLNLTDNNCQNLNGRDTFNLHLDIPSDISSMIGGQFVLKYNVTAYDSC